MIRFTRDGTRVKCTVATDVPNYDSRQFYFYWETEREYAAGLLSAHLTETYENNVGEIRREAYERGWKDAKAHRAKNNW